MKKLFSLVLVAVLAISIPAAAMTYGGQQQFTDVANNHWASWYIYEAQYRGLVSGVGDGRFNPEGVLTRAEVIQLLYNAYSYRLVPMPGGWIPHILDVGENDWYRSAVTWGAAVLNLFPETRGESGVYFYPQQPATRAWVADVLYQIAQRINFWSGPVLPDWTPAVHFNDLEGYANEELAIVSLQRAGVITGFPDGTFQPGGSLSRAQAATIMVRFTDLPNLESDQMRQ